MDLVWLHVFPEGALAHSVTTCVWVGVFVIVAFNLRFGWVLSGLVVPGYLAPLIFVKPWAAAVVVVQAAVTYLLVHAFSERGSRYGWWSGLFGRDRFFALVIVSIAVRLLFDGWLLPQFADWLTESYALTFDFRSNLHSFGLVIICLLANQFWKTGVLRGIVPVAVPILLTCLIIRFVLMELTNFSIGNLSYIYEDVAASLLASPKSYMVLVLAAFIASRMNLHYGWDFNGILIPALLALQWYQPEKILISFVEALLILAAARVVLKLPWLANVNIEGGRKLLLFFNLSFAYKLLLGWVVLWFDLDVNATDYYGFGYLLPTLIALKMHDKEIIARLSRATLQTSLTAVVIASLVAFGLSRVDLSEPFARRAATAGSGASIERTWKPLTELLKNETLDLYQQRGAEDLSRPLTLEVDRFSHALRLLEQHVELDAPEPLAEAVALLDLLDFDVLAHPDWVLIRERSPDRGWGSYVLARAPQRDLVLEVPAPLENGHLTQVSAHLFELYGARALAIAGSQLLLGPRRDPASLMDQASLFQTFHRSFADHDVLQLRGLNDRNRESLGRRGEAARWRTELRVDGGLPAALDLTVLQQLLGDYETFFEPSRTMNVQRRAARAGFAELFLATGSVRQLLYASLSRDGALENSASALVKPLFLNEWIESSREHIAPKGSNAYVGLSKAELLFLDEQVLSPMLDWIDEYGDRAATASALQALAGINEAASIVRHEVGLLAADSRDPLLFLSPLLEAPVRHSAFLALRTSGVSPHLVQAPRPLAEPGSLEFALRLFTETAARGLVVSGAHPAANLDGSADVLRVANKSNLFNLASQRLVRSAGDEALVLTQVRGRGVRAAEGSEADVLIARRFQPLGDALPALTFIDAHLERRGLSGVEVDGSLSTMGYENHLVLQNRYLDQSRNKALLTLWVAPGTRATDRFGASSRQLRAQLASVGVTVQEGSLAERLAGAQPGRELRSELVELVERYQKSADVLLLARLKAAARDSHLEALVDRRTQQVYLLAGQDPAQIAGAYLLGTGRGDGRRAEPQRLALDVAEFIDRGEAWLTLGGPS